MRALIVRTSSYKVTADYLFPKVLLHLDIYEWSHTVYKQLLDEFVNIINVLKMQDYELLESFIPFEDTQAVKLTTMFGYELDECIYEDDTGNKFYHLTRIINNHGS